MTTSQYFALSAIRVERTDRRELLVLVGIAFALRLACAVLFVGMIDTEGVEYARIAENLIAGVGYVGIASPGEQLFFPPLFPFSIASLSFLTGNVEIAGRIISIIMGSLLVVPVYAIARHMYGESIAYIAAVLTAIHPLLIQYSMTVFCESTFLTLILTAVWMSMRAMEDPSPPRFVLTGAIYALAYLVRPEAFAYLLIALVFTALWLVATQHRERLRALRGLLLAPLVFVLVAGPYIGWLTTRVGQFRLEGKTPLNIAVEMRMQTGMSGEEAAFGVDRDLTLRGVWMQPNIMLLQVGGPAAGVVLPTLAKRIKPVAQATLGIITDLRFGMPALFVLAVLGLFMRPWSRRFALDHLHIGAILSVAVMGTFFIYYVHPRFYLLFVPFFCIWGAAGLTHLSRWAARSAVLWDVPRFLRRYFTTSVQALALGAIILPSASLALVSFHSTRGERHIKEISADLGSDAKTPVRIADTSTQVAFHAGAAFTWLPYSDEATALRFLANSGVTHVVVQERDVEARPYLKKWMESGVPNAHRIVATFLNGKRFDFYEFDR